MALALQLVAEAHNAEVVSQALVILQARPAPEQRPALMTAYRYFEAQARRRDPGAAVRTALLKTLRPLARLEDRALAEQAVATYEFLLGEVAGDLRAAGLLLLAEIEPELAGYHAVRLLHDRHTSIMSGQPASTAARLLASQGQALPLYAFVSQPLGAEPSNWPVGEVVAEALRGLMALPTSLLVELVTRYRASRDEILLLGLFDLLLAHPSRSEQLPTLLAFLRETDLLTLYRSLAMTLATSHDEALIDALRGLAATERQPTKLALLREALALRAEVAAPGRRRRGVRGAG
jgi:hypothetical protein